MRRLLTLAALLAPMPALAHEGGAHVHGFMAGFVHPIGGLDHVLAMVAVGLWAGLLGGRALWALPAGFLALWALPAGFLAAMTLGFGLGAAGLGLPMVEAGILASVIILGALVAASARVSLALAVPLVALFGLLHGHAHGTELAGAGAFPYAAGFLIATALLHGLGVFGALAITNRVVVRLAGGAMAALMLAVAAI
ncbi:HupE/UreJ family protein [Falsiroseomonas tokyonensis]|uniref:HupE/UreJ family protein n=1 Tax=Falsiroseomonas tokyonensis TaxID=430521 RepID=A0ABV7BVT4_9PROT|nr:HupE/UreJ family protein [Falsiroseomonas tokyonensis]MBU8539645.1 HupE/UreJ family protein [Falsiroseomonas tokyonensis]